MTDQGVIILKREPGPAAGLTVVTVDAPGYKQAEFVIASHICEMPEEQVVLRKMLEQRRAENDALKQLEL